MLTTGYEGSRSLGGYTQAAEARADSAREEWLARVQDMPLGPRPLAYYRLYWRRQNRKAGMAAER